MTTHPTMLGARMTHEQQVRALAKRSVIFYRESLKVKGDDCAPYVRGRLTAREVLLNKGAFLGLCEAADVLGFAMTATQWRMWVQEAHARNPLGTEEVVDDVVRLHLEWAS